RTARGRLKHGGQSHLLEHVEAVVARGTVRSQRDRDAASPHFSHWRDAGAQLEIRAWAVKHLDVMSREQLLFMLVDPDAMRGTETRRSEADRGKVVDIGETTAGFTHQGNFVARLRRVRMHERTALGRQARHGLEQLPRTGCGES